MSEALFALEVEVAPEPVIDPKWDERLVADQLVKRYAIKPGNGPRYVVARQVRNGPSFFANRTCDFIAIDTWTNGDSPAAIRAGSTRRGLAVHGHEIKVSRGDWLRELKDPDKAEAFARFCAYWWIATPKGLLRPDELPKGWGLIEVTASGARTRVQATRREAEPMPWHMVIPLLRAVRDTAENDTRIAYEARIRAAAPSPTGPQEAHDA